MTVGELIAVLQTHDPAMLVTVGDSGVIFMATAPEVRAMHTSNGPHPITAWLCHAPAECGSCQMQLPKQPMLLF
jgi:hypothetical protein